VNGELGHALVLSRDAERLLFDLAPDLGKVDETLVEVEELAPLFLAAATAIAAASAARVDQLEDERAARYDALPARQEIAPDDAGAAVWLGTVGFILFIFLEQRPREGEGSNGERRGDGQWAVHSLFEYAGFACRLAADLQRGDSSMGVQRVSTARSLRTTTSWGMSSSPPTKATHDVGVIKLSKRWTATRYIETRGHPPRLLNVSWSLLTSFMRSSSMVSTCVSCYNSGGFEG